MRTSSWHWQFVVADRKSDVHAAIIVEGTAGVKNVQVFSCSKRQTAVMANRRAARRLGFECNDGSSRGLREDLVDWILSAERVSKQRLGRRKIVSGSLQLLRVRYR
jgi:hypothetical protein